MGWAVAVAAANREKWIVDAAKARGFISYLPRYMDRQRRPRLLFPRYVFLWLNESWRDLFALRGVRTLLMDGVQPSCVRDEVIEDLREQEVNGVVRLQSSAERFVKGQRLHVVRGQFKNTIAIYEGMSSRQCEMALMELLGRKVLVEFEDGHLAAFVD